MFYVPADGVSALFTPGMRSAPRSITSLTSGRTSSKVAVRIKEARWLSHVVHPTCRICPAVKRTFVECLRSSNYKADKLLKLLFDEFESYGDEVIYGKKKTLLVIILQ
ncbi:uncharacterized protein LOC114939503 [Nylanderia fulva]|uniref:uncharacterized protein LOC114939503 n=1 Tax=Nylanderia fulva TaxID=613905 RepID=UPI0010FB4150|nr:uncharacterized protein LOC114939503 [Nylanderia fulva]